MPADFRLVAHAAQRLANKFASAGLGDGAPERSLAHTGRADEAQDWPLQLVGARLNRQIFDDPVLHLFQRIMIVVEHVLRFGDVLLEPRLLAPGQAEQRIEIVAHDGRLGAHRLHALQLLQLGLRLGLGFLGQFQLLDLGRQLGQLVAILAVVRSQLALDRLHLLVQIIFALGLFHLALHAAPDLLFDLQHAKLALHEGERHFQALHDIHFDKQRLLVGHLDIDIAGNRIGQRGGIVDLAKLHGGFRRQLAVELGIIVELIDHRAHQRLHVLALGWRFLGKIDLRGAIAVPLVDIFQRDALLAFHQHAHGAIGQFQQLHDGGGHAHFIQIVAARIILGRIELCDEDDFLVVLHRLFQRDDGFVATDEKRHDHARKHNDVAKRQQR